MEELLIMGIEMPPVAAPEEGVAPEVTPEVAPEVTPEVAPEVTPEVTPEVAPEVTPEVTPEVAPEVTPEVMPEEGVAPEIMPELVPEKGSESVGGFLDESSVVDGEGNDVLVGVVPGDHSVSSNDSGPGGEVLLPGETTVSDNTVSDNPVLNMVSGNNISGNAVSGNEIDATPIGNVSGNSMYQAQAGTLIDYTQQLQDLQVSVDTLNFSVNAMLFVILFIFIFKRIKSWTGGFVA